MIEKKRKLEEGKEGIAYKFVVFVLHDGHK